MSIPGLRFGLCFGGKTRGQQSCRGSSSQGVGSAISMLNSRSWQNPHGILGRSLPGPTATHKTLSGKECGASRGHVVGLGQRNPPWGPWNSLSNDGTRGRQASQAASLTKAPREQGGHRETGSSSPPRHTRVIRGFEAEPSSTPMTKCYLLTVVSLSLFIFPDDKRLVPLK